MTEDERKKYTKPDGEVDWEKYEKEVLLPELHNSPKKSNVIDINDLPVFKIADKLCDKVWDMVAKWDYFSKKTLGDQIVRSADSVAANITEGYGRYFFGDYITFLYYARGSLYETIFWLEKARKRGLIDEKSYLEMKREYDKLPVELNKVVKLVKTQAYKWKGKPKW